MISASGAAGRSLATAARGAGSSLSGMIMPPVSNRIRYRPFAPASVANPGKVPAIMSPRPPKAAVPSRAPTIAKAQPLSGGDHPRSTEALIRTTH